MISGWIIAVLFFVYAQDPEYHFLRDVVCLPKSTKYTLLLVVCDRFCNK